jgi:hypothetical protein
MSEQAKSAYWSLRSQTLLRDVGYQNMNEEKPTRIPAHTARSIWWAFFWRTTLFTIIAGFLLGIPLGLFKSLMQLSDASWNIIKTLTTWGAYCLISISVMSHILAKPYSAFIISITKKEPNHH